MKLLKLRPGHCCSRHHALCVVPGFLRCGGKRCNRDLASHDANPAAQAFQYAAGTFGFKLFGLIFWAAGISSTIGAAYTSVSFFTAFKRT